MFSKSRRVFEGLFLGVKCGPKVLYEFNYNEIDSEGLSSIKVFIGNFFFLGMNFVVFFTFFFVFFIEKFCHTNHSQNVSEALNVGSFLDYGFLAEFVRLKCHQEFVDQIRSKISHDRTHHPKVVLTTF